MQHSEQPHVELKRARLAISSMKEANSLDDFEEHWKEFLRRIERVWSKTASHFGKSPKWQSWHGKVEGLRRTDPLLAYLVNARGAEEHTVNEIVDREGAGIGIDAAEGNRLFIEKLTFKNGVMRVESPQKLKFTFIGARTRLLPVKNRGRIYPVPNLHLGNRIDPSRISDLAELSVLFYERTLASAEQYFVK